MDGDSPSNFTVAWPVWASSVGFKFRLVVKGLTVEGLEFWGFRSAKESAQASFCPPDMSRAYAPNLSQSLVPIIQIPQSQAASISTFFRALKNQ